MGLIIDCVRGNRLIKRKIVENAYRLRLESRRRNFCTDNAAKVISTDPGQSGHVILLTIC